MIHRTRPAEPAVDLYDFEAAVCQHVTLDAPDLLAAIFGVTE